MIINTILCCSPLSPIIAILLLQDFIYEHSESVVSEVDGNYSSSIAYIRFNFFDKYNDIERFTLRRSSINEASVRDLASTYHEQSRVCK